MFAITDIIVWQTIALKGYNTTIILALGYMLLLALFSILWVEGALVYGMAGFGVLAVGAWMKHAGFTFADAVAVYGGIGFGLYLLARLIEPLSVRFKAWTVWLTPLTQASITLTALAALASSTNARGASRWDGARTAKRWPARSSGWRWMRRTTSRLRG
jgi:hypothetical protein